MGTAVQLAGKVVAVTGGARGIGRAIATAFAAGGAKVAIGDIDKNCARTPRLRSETAPSACRSMSPITAVSRPSSTPSRPPWDRST